MEEAKDDVPRDDRQTELTSQIEDRAMEALSRARNMLKESLRQLDALEEAVCTRSAPLDS